MDLGLTGLRVLITAGAAGIGRETALAFREEGAKVFVCDVDTSALAEMKDIAPEIGQTVCDVADRSAVTAMFERALKHLGGLDVLINNAGIAGPTGRIEEINVEDWDRCVDVCLTSMFNCTRLAVPHLKASGNASIINLSSAAGIFGFPMRTPYAAAKWGVVGLSKSLAIELGEYGIRCNAICPGLVAGDRIRRVIEAKSQARGVAFKVLEDEALSKTSLRSYVTARQLADQMMFLCSDKGRTITGQAISVDGGTTSLA
jgi:NAD(P)-dependent dehydrogenase (short-subunit alcohol dehydrogenase family)